LILVSSQRSVDPGHPPDESNICCSDVLQ
jgi:hypothetical protein